VWGDGKEFEKVRQLVLESPFRDRIHLKGRAPRDSIGEIMRSHSVYCMPSYGEPFGMTILEAMASGVPVVTTNVGGPAYLVREQGGRTVPIRDAAQLAEALIEVLSDRELQKSMGRYNRRRIEQELDWSHSLDRMESVYESMLDTSIDSSLARLRDGPRTLR
jgi:glycosyltransferase involved in cell wall biosynthesis